MEIKNKNKQMKSFYIPLLLVLIVIAGIVAVTTSFREAAEDARRTSADTSSDIPVVAPAADTAPDKDRGTLPDKESEKEASLIPDKEEQTEQITDAPESEEPAAEAPVEPTFISPVSGVVSKGFSVDVPVFSETMNDYRVHTGVDVTGGSGEAVLAAADGTVGAIWDDPLMGKCMTVVHDCGFVTTYKGLHEIIPEGIAQGVEVKAGQPIAALGESALIEIAEEPHVHFEMTKDGAAVDPCTYVTFAASENYGE